VVGSDNEQGARAHGFLLSKGSFSVIDFPGGPVVATAFGINPAGNIVGLYSFDNIVTEGYLLNNGSFTTIIDPSGRTTIPYDVNPAGEIVGSSSDYLHGFLLSKGSFSTIDVPGALWTIPYGIDSAVDIVGGFLGSDYSWHGFLLSRK